MSITYYAATLDNLIHASPYVTALDYLQREIHQNGDVSKRVTDRQQPITLEIHQTDLTEDLMS